jgi:hypothetical protein
MQENGENDNEKEQQQLPQNRWIIMQLLPMSS